ncbi:MAG: bifunctional glutamate N-acetyltransferase/amino-acid acetyltransferase ArgJ [Acidobacteriaceae bacterium]|nr:bifunctional glutamate N-acetyltransferase/amino-acid acetyltransferase ArgJ [Acidobacteriaceae bacterium]
MLSLPLGYRYAAVYAGIRKQTKGDLALIVPDQPAQAAAVFTQNVVQAAPVRLARKHLRSSSGKVAGVIVNAGNANCATRTGDNVALSTCKALGRALDAKRNQIIPSSTGVIGVELEPKLITEAIPGLVEKLSSDAFQSVAEAIMTTDTRVKIASEELKLKQGVVRVAGMTKGSGMIHPNMATTLGFVMTDAAVDARDLQKMLMPATERSYNSLSVDGDMSTNDMVLLLANGASGIEPDAKERLVVSELITWVMESLAEQIAADGEGARKLIVIRTCGFKTDDDARRIARTIANSPLVKTAIAGNDPNWGRILSAAGYSGVSFDPSDIDIDLQGLPVCRGGLAAEFEENELKERLDAAEVRIKVASRSKRKGHARFFTCDFTEGYIQINGSYRT